MSSIDPQAQFESNEVPEAEIRAAWLRVLRLLAAEIVRQLVMSSESARGTAAQTDD